MTDNDNNCPSCAETPEHPVSAFGPLPGNPNVVVQPYSPPTQAELEFSRNFYATMEAHTGRSPFTDGIPVQTQDPSPGRFSVAEAVSRAAPGEAVPMPDTSDLPMVPNGPGARFARVAAESFESPPRPPNGLGGFIYADTEVRMPHQLTAPWFEARPPIDFSEASWPHGLFPPRPYVSWSRILWDWLQVLLREGAQERSKVWWPGPGKWGIPPIPNAILIDMLLQRRRSSWNEDRHGFRVFYEGVGTEPCTVCDHVEAVQIIKREDSEFPAVGAIPEDFPKTDDGWVIDHNSTGHPDRRCKKGERCSPFYGHHFPGSWSKSEDGSGYELKDSPFTRPGRTDEFEVCFACCKEGSFRGWLGCVSGIRIETTQARTQPPGPVIRTVSNGKSTVAPSRQFIDAMIRFNNYYNGSANDPNPACMGSGTHEGSESE